MYESALAAGITSFEYDAYLLRVTTTSSVSYIARIKHFDCEIMISVSYNLYFESGIKLKNVDGEKMDDELQDEVEK